MGIDSLELRQTAFEHVRQIAERRGGTITRRELEAFVFHGVPIPLIAPMQGINNPKALDATISVVSSPTGPYDDGSPSDGIWDYAYEGTTPGRTNIKLRQAYEMKLPILYLEKVSDAVYIPYSPVLVIGNRPADLRFEMALADIALLGDPSEDTEVERVYRAAVVERRLHQPQFRARVLTAYESQCAVCRLRHAELLDGAHIIPDRDAHGIAAVSNGMALCKIHHAAYDEDLLGVTPDYEVRINRQLLAEADGPMLRHGLQEMHGVSLTVPRTVRLRPDRERLAERYAQFLSV